MSDEANGDGDHQKSQGDEQEQQPNKIKLSKEELSNKIVEGRNEGIQKGQKDTISTVNEALGTSFESVDQLAEELPNKTENPEVVEELQNKLSEKDQKIQSYESKIQDIRVRSSIEQNVNDSLGDKKDLSLGIKDVRSLMENRGYDYTEKGGEILVTKDGDRVIGEDGNYKTYSEALIDFSKEMGFIEGNAKGGTGGASNPSGGSESNPFETGNYTEQAKLYNEDPQRYKRLKKAAGK